MNSNAKAARPVMNRKKQAFLAAVDTMAGELKNAMFAEIYRTAVRSMMYGEGDALFRFLTMLERVPVSIEEFLDSEEFMGATDLTMWPEVRTAIIDINKNWWRGLEGGAYNEGLMMGATGTAKCLAKGTPVILFDGRVKKVEDVRVGDQLMGPDSTPRNVLSLASGREEMFTVTPIRGDAYTVNRSHILSLKITGMGVTRHGHPKTVTGGNGRVYRSGDIADLTIDEYLKSSKTFKHVAKGWRPAAVEWGGRPSRLAIDPYFLGLWLGDGSSCGPYITTADAEIVEYLHRFAASEGLRVNAQDSGGTRCQTYQLVNARGADNVLRDEMAQVGLLKRREKRVPRSYLLSSCESRWALLAGLIDSDGHRNSKTTQGDGYAIVTKYSDLRDDILFLARSLGLSATSVEEEYRCQNDGGGFYHRIYLCGDMSAMPCLLPRKKPSGFTGKTNHLLTGVSVTPAGEGEYYGFEIDGDRRFLLGDFTVTHNTTISMVSTLYHVYLVSCLQNPQAYYGLPKATSIVWALMGAKPRVISKVIYLPMRKFLESMPYFQKYCMPDKLIESEMYFPEKNLRIAQSGGDEDAILGEAIIGGIIDEINFMNVVLRSKKAEVSSGRAGLYDQATQVHSTMTRRKRGRFTRPGPALGIIFPSSSTKYKGDFTDKHKAFVERAGIKTTYIYNRRQFDVVPQERFSGKKFRLVIGNDIHHDTRVLKDGEQMPEGAWVVEVPIEYQDDFEKRPFDALRDVLGISNNALSPFIKTRHKIYECVEAGKELNLQSILVRDHVILGEHGMPQVKQGTYCANPSRPRYVHIDMSRNADRCGIAMLRFDGMREVGRKDGGKELLPVATVELACSIQPDANNEIDVGEVRAFVKHLKTKYGYPIRVVSYDGVDSRESIQQWRKDGMRAVMISVDRTSAPYKQFRDALYDVRVNLPDDSEQVLVSEILDLEYDETPSRDKIDHPVNGSKDVSDAVCGAYTSMLERKSTWMAAAADDAAHAENMRAVFDERFDEGRRA